MDQLISNQLTMFDVQNYEYSFIVSPIKRIKTGVNYIRKHINDVIPISDKDLSSVPHISLLRVKYANDDNFILSLFKQALMYSKKFKVELNGLNFLDNKNTKMVYLNIANPEPILSIHKNLLSTFRFKEETYVPHLTVARAIANSDANKIEGRIPEYNDHFWCSKIVVLKKPVTGSKTGSAKYTRIYEALLN